MNKYENKLGTPSGFRDLLPQEAGGRERLIEAITRVYKRFGFLPLETPVAEFKDVLLSESDTDFNLFHLESNNKREGENLKEEVSLRFDLTVPLARAVSQYGNALPRPFKRYQSGYVFRGERPQKGRYRQFMQFDADIVGTKSLLADTEMIVMIVEIMKELEVSDFVVRVNTRTLLDTLPGFASFPQNLLREVLIVLDKAEKISEQELELELERLRINQDGIQKIKKLSTIAESPEKALATLREFFKGYELADDGLRELETISANLTALGIADKVLFDMKIIRGFAYYTGPVFETNLLKAPEFGSVISGGRYDNLVERFSTQSLPAVGVSVGVDRFETALSSLGLLSSSSSQPKIVIFGLEAPQDYVVRVGDTLRQKNMVVDTYVGTKNDFKDLFKYAESVGADYVCVIGSQEVLDQSVSIKNLASREQKVYPFTDLKTIDL